MKSEHVPRYPIYVISKGRAESSLTARTLMTMGVDHRVVIEPQEEEEYAKHLPRENLLILPFSNLGQGSIPARNWVWEHSIEAGAKRHWILDDNIRGFFRLHKNRRIRIQTGACFAAAEDFTDRYTNVPMSGFQYATFAPSSSKFPPFIKNTRVYSCILLSNEIPHRWRGRYNEDTDLSLRILKDGYCTILFYAFLAGKVATMTMTGGNTEDLYKLEERDGRLAMAQSLVNQHPDVTTIWKRWGRWQHKVDYSQFRKRRLIKREDYVPSGKANEYGMVFREGLNDEGKAPKDEGRKGSGKLRARRRRRKQ
jgi:hypothetical protein